jgi:hypothetical protein
MIDITIILIGYSINGKLIIIIIIIRLISSINLKPLPSLGLKSNSQIIQMSSSLNIHIWYNKRQLSSSINTSTLRINILTIQLTRINEEFVLILNICRSI